MKIIRDKENVIYSDKNKALGNCFTVIEDNIYYYYEFKIISNCMAIILYENDKYINEVIDEFRFYNFYIYEFYTEENILIKKFEFVYTFKLPINIIQPSQLFINEDKLRSVKNYLIADEIYIPVTIINDEYILLDGHTRLFYLHNIDKKMVNVYLDKPFKGINDFIYLAKENNVFKINNLSVLSNDDYKLHWDTFCDMYFNGN